MGHVSEPPVKDLTALCAYIRTYAHEIYVRECIDGEWGSYALTELPPDRAIAHALRFVQELARTEADEQRERAEQAEEELERLRAERVR